MIESDIRLLVRCADFTLEHTAKIESDIIARLQNDGATRHVEALRIFQLQRAVLAVGMFSLFESLLQDTLGWDDPFKNLPKYLSEHAQDGLSSRFEQYREAVNVLKHGDGRAYRKLIQAASSLEFKIKMPDQIFFEEGDVSEVGTLIYVDDQFVRRCAEIIQAVASVIAEKEQIWI